MPRQLPCTASAPRRFSRSIGSPILWIALAWLTLVSITAPSVVAAAPTVGFLEEWSSTTTSWGGGGFPTNPGTGGFLGDGDGYLRIANSFPGHLGSFSVGGEYVGDWMAAGITQVGVWLNDVDTDDPLEIHFLIGVAQSNIWQYNVGFLPPENAWGQFLVDLSSSVNWTRTQGTGTFTAALQNVDRVLWRHDLAPYVQTPDNIQADVGVDHMLLTNGSVGVGARPAMVHVPVELAPPSPNPSRGPVSVAMRTPDGSRVRIEVVDLAGRRIRSAQLPEGDAGLRVWLWDGCDDFGVRVPPGAYRVRAWGPSGGTSRSLVRVR